MRRRYAILFRLIPGLESPGCLQMPLRGK